jgi:hypothetical protein
VYHVSQSKPHLITNSPEMKHHSSLHLSDEFIDNAEAMESLDGMNRQERSADDDLGVSASDYGEDMWAI